MRYLSRGIVLGIALLGATASAQTPETRLNTLDAKTRSAVVAIIDSARAMNLPIAPLIDKAREGAAKKANGQQIISAVRTYVVQLAEARRALGDKSTEPELIGGAQAIRAGIPMTQLQRLRNVRPGVQIAAALTVVSDLVSREVPIDTAVNVVADLVNVAATDDQILGVRADIETDILGGLPPALAASMRGDALEKTIAAGVPTNGGDPKGALPSPSGTNRGEPGGVLQGPPRASGNVQGPPKPPASQRKRPQ